MHSAEQGFSGAIGPWGFAAIEADMRVGQEHALLSVVGVEQEPAPMVLGHWGFAIEEAHMTAARLRVERCFAEPDNDLVGHPGRFAAGDEFLSDTRDWVAIPASFIGVAIPAGTCVRRVVAH
ncbi:MAG TPA: hypothetical protein VJ743_21150 [Albitalea sp.]|nr:hypothetical protein [Albitalea sp.]